MADIFMDQTKTLASSGQYKAIMQIPGWQSALTGGADHVSSAASAYARVPLIFRALRLRCDNLSSVPVYIESGETAKDWPWPDFDLQEAIWKTEAALLLTGSAFWLKQNNRVRTTGLQWLNPYGMTVQYSGGQYQFIYSWTNGNDTQTATYTSEEIVYFREFNPLDDVLPGVSAGQASLTAAALRRYGMRFASYFFEGGAMPALLLGIPQSTTDAERERTENWFRRRLTGIANAFRVVAVKAGLVDAKVLTPSMRDMVIPELNALALEDISAAFGIRKSILGDPANYAVSKEDWDSFWKTTVRPRGRMYEAVINKQLLARYGLKIRFAFDELDVFQEDENARASSLKALTDAGMPIDLAASVLGFDLDEDQWSRLKEIANRPAPQPVIVNSALPEQSGPTGDTSQQDPVEADLKRWQRASEKRLKEKGSAAYPFQSEHIPASLRGAILGALETAGQPADVHRIFANALQWRQYP